MGMIQNKVTVSQPVSHVIVNDAGGLRGLTGEQGPQGPQGIQGPQGEQGIQGPQGIPGVDGKDGKDGQDGAAATISVGSTSTLPAGSSATVTNSGTSSAAVFDFGIPKGDKGDTGATGADGYSPTATVTKSGDTATITITDKNGTTTASVSDGTTPTVNDGTLTIQKNGTTVQTFSADQASNVTADITVPTQFSDLSGKVSSAQIEDEAITTGSVSGSGTNITLAGTMDGGAIESVEMKGDTTQQTYSGKNLYVNSQDFGGSNWNSSAYWTTDSSTYNGLVVKTRSNAWQGISQTLSVESGKTYTFSLFVKAGSARNAGLYLNHYESGAATITPTSASISVTTEWQRYSVTFSVTSSGTVRPRLELFENFNTPVYICGYQLEQNSSMTAYEPYVGGASPNPDYPQNVNVVTGEQSVWLHGKNLCDGVPQGYFLTSTGELAGQSQNDSGLIVPVEKNTNYTISTAITQTRYRIGFVDTLYQGSPLTAYNGAGMDGTNNTITRNSGTHGYLIVNATDLTKIQIELGSSATTYEPYQGVTKTVNLGKNLFDKDNANTINAYINSTSPHGITTDSSSSCVYVPCQPNTTYTISRTAGNVFRAVTTSQTPASGVTTSDYVGNDSGSAITLTTSSGSKYLVIEVRNYSSTQTLDDILASLQIEKGSVATTYAPYFTPIELCKIGTYQDKIYKSGDDWYVRKETNKAIFNGSEDWTRNVVSTNQVYYRVATTIANQTQGYSNYLTVITNSASLMATDNCIRVNSGNVDIHFSATNNPSLSDFQTWLGTHNTSIYYILGTATDTKITNATLISELDSLLSATTYDNNTYITVSGDLASPLEVVAEADSKLAPNSVYGASIKDGAVSVSKIADLKALADALSPYLS